MADTTMKVVKVVKKPSNSIKSPLQNWTPQYTHDIPHMHYDILPVSFTTPNSTLGVSFVLMQSWCSCSQDVLPVC